MRVLFLAAALLVFGAPTQAAGAAGNTTHLSHGRFREFVVYAPKGTPASFVLFLSGDDGWTPTTDTMAQQLVQQGAMVVAIDFAKFKAVLEADAHQCEFPDGDLENLSHFVQAYFHVPSYLPPMLAGVSSGATFAYAMLVQAPRNTFAAALTLGFCPSLELDKPLCKGTGLESVRRTHGRGADLLPIKALGNPWVDLQSNAGQACPAGAAREFISQVRGAAIVMLPKTGHGFTSPSDWLPQYIAGYNRLSA